MVPEVQTLLRAPDQKVGNTVHTLRQNLQPYLANITTKAYGWNCVKGNKGKSKPLDQAMQGVLEYQEGPLIPKEHISFFKYIQRLLSIILITSSSSSSSWSLTCSPGSPRFPGSPFSPSGPAQPFGPTSPLGPTGPSVPCISID